MLCACSGRQQRRERGGAGARGARGGAVAHGDTDPHRCAPQQAPRPAARALRVV